MSLDMHSYWMGRDKESPKEWTADIQANGAETTRRINNLLDIYVGETANPRPTVWASGWRTAAVNTATANAAKKSTHLTAQAGDVADDAARSLAHWCMSNQRHLADCGLWCEDFRWTGGPGHSNWCHFQTVQPKSGNRIYIPSAKPVLDPNF